MFDCYRPDRAVKDFAAWVRQSKSKDALWHPNVRRSDLIKQGYIASRSGHSRGSTVDLAIAPASPDLSSIPPAAHKTHGTLDFGTGFDCLTRKAAPPIHRSLRMPQNRKLLVDAMNAQGFRNYKNEWWHFTLNNEPFSKRFDFPVTAE